ncbi:hypothetical protein F0919_07445 [Taibaiella lutea]|uniref:Uncharacterized protein n=1 Tax=Taibaiella lutea TaxID=2608001 RepID=A0A5M6CJ16_9BACT|nr:hypothetical protein [Taibaiella lutea]KAA5534450.1 hypothetical protein F0919_07445 [Taibaiella lutea]
MIKKYTLALAAVLCFAASCNKDKDMVNATVVDTGDITNVGCGYLLQLEDSAYLEPLYLSSAYQHGGLRVKVKFTHTGVVDTCDYANKVFDQVSIQEIKNLND